jgi:L-xylulokinase
MHTPVFIGLDCGTSVIKAAAFDASGTELATGESRMETSSPAPGQMEFHPGDLWKASQEALRSLCAKLDPARIAALGITGAGNGLTLADAGGTPLRPGILAVDNRASSLSDLSVSSRPINGQCQWPGQTLQLLRWFAANEPETLAQAKKIFVIKDYVKWQLTGDYMSDYSEQSKIGLLDLETRTASDRLLGIFGLADIARNLPPLSESCAVIGRVATAAAALTGLPAGLPVVNGLADIDASALGSGACQAGHLSVVAGTWSINQFFTSSPDCRSDIFGTSLHAVSGLREELEASASSTANLTWFVREACRDLETEAASQGLSVYDLVNREVAAVPPCSTPVFFHPYLFGSNTEPNARAGFYGLAGWQERRHLLAALFEGVVFSHAVHIERLLAGGRAATEVFLSGGASRSRVWSQMFADALGLPLSVPAAREVGALGAAMCASVGHGSHPDLPAAAAAMCRSERRHEPNPTLSAAYSQRYATFKEITELMKPVWRAIEKSSATHQ